MPELTKSARIHNAPTMVCLLACLVAACNSSPPRQPYSPGQAVTVTVNNHSGGAITVSFSFARTPATRLGSVGRLAEAEFSFEWEPGPLEFVVDLPGALLTSNRLSTRIGDRVHLDVSSREAKATKEGGGT